jgi:signal transduction histidine kinase
VLNDVLSFNRMEAGKFTQARKPFDFHKSINLVALSHRPQATSSGIQLNIDLDPDIDKVGGVFIGDEMRLRQITSNLVSNSIKFTEQGSVRIVTKLIYPRLDLATSNEDLEGPLREAAENLHKQQQAEAADSKRYSGDLEKMGTASGRDSLDMEKGSIHLESLRHQHDPKLSQSHTSHEAVTPRDGRDDKSRRKAIVRVEIHDTGIGLKKDDLEE